MGTRDVFRRAFTLLELMVVVTLIAIVLGVLIPVIGESREHARRTQCVNNLKQIGLGIQNYEDVRKEVCPAYLTSDNSPRAEPRDGPSWAIVVLALLDQINWYDFYDFTEPLSSDLVGPLVPNLRYIEPGQTPPPNVPMIHIPDHPTARRISIPTYFCPTRRSPPQLTANGAASVGDYASVSRADLMPLDPQQPRTWDAAMLACRVFNASKQEAMIDGIRLGPADFRAMTRFQDITDGLSQTLLIGEKAVRADRFGGHRTDPAKSIQPDQQDGTYYYGGLGVENDLADLRAPGAIAYWSRRLAPAGTERTLPRNPREDDPANRFGGWHPGVTLFVAADGSIKTIGHGGSNRVLQTLGCRNDGSPAEAGS
jgi:prepilin-type N-terminal cleavage/methylation domain-containing protein